MGGRERCVTGRWRLPPSPSVALLKVKVFRPSVYIHPALALSFARVLCHVYARAFSFPLSPSLPLSSAFPAARGLREKVRGEARRSLQAYKCWCGREAAEGEGGERNDGERRRTAGTRVGDRGCVPGVARARCPVFIALANRSIAADSDTAQLGSPRTELLQPSSPSLSSPAVHPLPDLSSFAS